MFSDITATAIRKTHKQYLISAEKVSLDEQQKDIWYYIRSNHIYNYLLWEEEDQARRTNVSDSCIAKNKRSIDKYNQQRNDFIEKIDEMILSRVPKENFNLKGIWINSETVGSIIDRMSINSLKCFHMEKQKERKEASEEHVNLCAQKLSQLLSQGIYLATSLDLLLKNIEEKKAIFKAYYQFKMYNDKTLNPYLYSEK